LPSDHLRGIGRVFCPSERLGVCVRASSENIGWGVLSEQRRLWASKPSGRVFWPHGDGVLFQRRRCFLAFSSRAGVVGCVGVGTHFLGRGNSSRIGCGATTFASAQGGMGSLGPRGGDHVTDGDGSR
jgi:hypothetical protein